VHFQISELLEVTDVDMVVSTLEESLRALAKDVVRAEQELVAFGIGPSPKVKNARDRAVFQSTPVNAGVEVKVDVNYQASGLLGGVSQDEVVRDKILGVIAEARLVLRHRSGGRLPSSVKHVVEKQIEVPRTPIAVMPAAAESVVEVFAAPVVAVTDPIAVVEEIQAVPVEVQGVPVEVTATNAAPVAAVVKKEAGGSVIVAVVEALPEVAAAAIEPAPTPTPDNAADRVIAEWRDQLRQGGKAPLEGYGGAGTGRGGRVWGWVGALVLCIGAGAAWVVTHPHRVEAPPVVATQTQTEGEAGGAGNSLPWPSETEEKDLTSWLQNWADAMSSHDAEVQTAFYADPVDRYFRASNVGHAALLESKREALENSDALTTMTIEQIEIVKQTDDSANVRLVKHIVTQSPHHSQTDQMVHCQLKVKRIEGSWRIVEEHNLL
jgi:hypothetical protein